MPEGSGFASQLSELRKITTRLENDMYYGNGKNNPSLTVRMDRLETYFEKISKNMSKIVWLVLAAAITVIVDIIVRAKH